MTENSPKTVLVYVGLDLVGDGVMKLPFLASLRRLFPAARITWLAGQGRSVYAGALAPLVQDLLDEVIEEAGLGQRASELLSRPLAGRRFDLVLDTQRRVLTSLILRRVRHGCFISAAADWRLSDRVPPSGRGKRPAMIAQMLALLEAAAGAALPPPPPIIADPALLTQADHRLPAGRCYLGLAPGAGGKHKCWPLPRFIAVAQAALLRDMTPVFLLGPAERDWEAEIRAALPAALMPLTDADLPPATIALASRLRAAIANDSGTGHMLAAAGVPLLSLFGPTSPAKFAPLVARGAVLTAQEFGDMAMTAIPVDAVIAALDRLLTVSLPRPPS